MPTRQAALESCGPGQPTRALGHLSERRMMSGGGWCLSPNGPCVTCQHSLSQKELKEEAWASTVAPTVTPRPPAASSPAAVATPSCSAPLQSPPTGACPRVPCRWALALRKVGDRWVFETSGSARDRPLSPKQ